MTRAVESSLLLVTLALALAPMSTDLRAQGMAHRDGASGPPHHSPGDSASLHDEARGAQRRFEQLRRNRLPKVLGSGGGGTCDDVVGRMCWNHGPTTLWRARPEDPGVGGARTSLLEELGRVGGELPGDEWVLGQRVWYLIEDGRAADAAALARGCGGSPPWWCSALEGLALHVVGRYVLAEDAFDRALAAMEPGMASEWEDVRLLLDGDARELLRETAARSVEEGARMVARMWSLADPLVLAEGNDRWTEHFARRTVIRLRADAANTYGMPWGDDLAELLLRYGWEVGWEQAPPSPGSLGPSTHVIGHEHPDSRAFLVSGKVLGAPTSAPREAWEPSGAFRPSTYAPGYAPVVLPLSSDLVVLSRGDHALIAAGYRLPADTTFRTRNGARSAFEAPPAWRSEGALAGMFVFGEEGEPVARTTSEGLRQGAFELDLPVGEYWVSVEVLDPGVGRAGRLRRGVTVPLVAPDMATLSPLLLLEPGAEPSDAEDALSRLAPDDVVEPGRPFLVGWEIWGLGWREEVLTYRLVVEATGGGLLRRAGRLVGLVGRTRPVSLSWEEPGPGDPGPTFRSVTVDLPEVKAGDYVIRLEVDSPGRTTLVARRQVRIDPGG